MRAALTKLRIVNALHARRAPFNSGFSRKNREKLLEFQVGLYCTFLLFPGILFDEFLDSRFTASGKGKFNVSFQFQTVL